MTTTTQVRFANSQNLLSKMINQSNNDSIKRIHSTWNPWLSSKAPSHLEKIIFSNKFMPYWSFSWCRYHCLYLEYIFSMGINHVSTNDRYPLYIDLCKSWNNGMTSVFTNLVLPNLSGFIKRTPRTQLWMAVFKCYIYCLRRLTLLQGFEIRLSARRAVVFNLRNLEGDEYLDFANVLDVLSGNPNFHSIIRKLNGVEPKFGEFSSWNQHLVKATCKTSSILAVVEYSYANSSINGKRWEMKKILGWKFETRYTVMRM